MLAHIAGWSTVAAIAVIAVGFIRFSFTYKCPPLLQVPQAVEAELVLSSGADYVGVV